MPLDETTISHSRFPLPPVRRTALDERLEGAEVAIAEIRGAIQALPTGRLLLLWATAMVTAGVILGFVAAAALLA